MVAKALSIQQPWAWAIVVLGKSVENRGAGFTGRHFGEVFIHASKEPREIEDLRDIVSKQELMSAYEAQKSGEMSLGAIVGVARIYAYKSSRDARLDLPAAADRWIEGPLCLCLDDVRKLSQPVPCKGALGFWNVPADVEAEVRRQLAMVETENVTPEEQRERMKRQLLRTRNQQPRTRTHHPTARRTWATRSRNGRISLLTSARPCAKPSRRFPLPGAICSWPRRSTPRLLRRRRRRKRRRMQP